MTESVLDGKSILAVDDEMDILLLLEEFILDSCPKCRIEKATTYEDAAKLIKSRYWDIVILDIPQLEGPVKGKALDLMELATRRWTEKEALLKALGLGLQADPLDIKIGKDIQFSNKALKRYQELGRPGYLLETSRLDPGYYLSTVADLN